MKRYVGRQFVAVSISLVGLASLAFARNASAADESMIFEKHQKNYESPQHFEFELRLAPYKADIDSDPDLKGATPYGNVFGSTPRILVAVELDWQVFRIKHVGSLGPGFGVGYTSMSAPAKRVDNGQSSAENTSLDVYPMYLAAVFRLDMFNKDFGIPLVPYAKAGVGLAFWRAYNDIGTSSTDGIEGKGHTFGYHVAGGLSLDLNAFDHAAAHNFDESMGVNHTYLYGEWMFMALDGIGQSAALRVGTSTWVAGLALEF
ncbi:MAG: MXAN_2562 family outer membrane beta-barrel protein [Polyangiaceae bacterium]